MLHTAGPSFNGAKRRAGKTDGEVRQERSGGLYNIVPRHRDHGDGANLTNKKFDGVTKAIVSIHDSRAKKKMQFWAKGMNGTFVLAHELGVESGSVMVLSGTVARGDYLHSTTLNYGDVPEGERAVRSPRGPARCTHCSSL